MKRYVPGKMTKQSERGDSLHFEAEVVPGLETITSAEIGRVAQGRVSVEAPREGSGRVRFVYRGDIKTLLRLKTAQAVYLVERFAIPRPKALLGDQHFRTLIRQIETVRQGGGSYETLHLSAAGSDSLVMTRLKDLVAAATGLRSDPEQGDLLLRVRRNETGDGWETLVRLGQRPLATRRWRVCNLEGALNASVAQAMVLLTEPKPEDTYINLACGSASLLIERCAWGAARHIVGLDENAAILACGKQNLVASGYQRRVALLRADARTNPLPNGCADALTVDLPFGQAIGSHSDNLRLYPALLHDAARLAKPGARLVAVTHEVRLMEQVLSGAANWQTERVIKITLRGLHPRIYVLRRV